MILESKSRAKDNQYHRRFQIVIAAIFLGCAVMIAVWMFVAPGSDDVVGDGIQTFFIQAPLLIIFALIGMNALVRLGMGSKRRY